MNMINILRNICLASISFYDLFMLNVCIGRQSIFGAYHPRALARLHRCFSSFFVLLLVFISLPFSDFMPAKAALQLQIALCATYCMAVSKQANECNFVKQNLFIQSILHVRFVWKLEKAEKPVESVSKRAKQSIGRNQKREENELLPERQPADSWNNETHC